ncbi:hypothetical protein QD460_31610 [Rhizobium jaguaris]|uniref:hypothetical protein n=1 Tax=Rhizobium jaguaris TaxID=1312183 RepID=UPI0039BEEAA0
MVEFFNFPSALNAWRVEVSEFDVMLEVEVSFLQGEGVNGASFCITNEKDIVGAEGEHTRGLQRLGCFDAGACRRRLVTYVDTVEVGSIKGWPCEHGELLSGDAAT